jgi:serine protease Do
LRDGSERQVRAEVLGVAPEYDVALLKAKESPNLEVAVLGDSDTTEIGDWVMAIGNPFGLTHSASVGIISAKERREVMPSGRQGLYDFLQTDASINPGNSGGPLLNARGEVIGINAAVNAQGQGIGFAVPINIAKAVLPQLRESGHFARSWIGVRIQSLTPDLATSFGLKQPRGVLVAEVIPQSPGAKAGLREGDVILDFEGRELVRATDLPLAAGIAGVGKTVKVTVWRDGATRELSLQLVEAPKEKGDEEQEEAFTGAPAEPDHLGLSITTMTPALRTRLKSKVDYGVLVTDVVPGGLAAESGLRPGDVVYQARGERVESARNFVKLFESTQPQQILRLRIDRQGMQFFIAMRRP